LLGRCGQRLHHQKLGVVRERDTSSVLQTPEVHFLCAAGTLVSMQLNMYGFHKQKEKCHSSYHYFGHDSFKRRDVESHDTTVVLATIKRKPEKKKRVEEGTIDR
jgi:hypothetical protein